MITFSVPGKPVPFTRVLKGSQQKRAQRYRDYKRDVGWAAKAAGAELLDGYICIWVTWRTTATTRGTTDVDNVGKGVRDALQGICYLNDRSVVMNLDMLIMGCDEECVEVVVWRKA